MRSIGLRDASDLDIFRRARKDDAIVMSKDYDFVNLIKQYGTPPKLIWITAGNTFKCGNVRNFEYFLLQAIDLLSGGEEIVEISSDR